MHARVISDELLLVTYISTQKLPQRRYTNAWAPVASNLLSFIEMPAMGRVK